MHYLRNLQRASIDPSRLPLVAFIHDLILATFESTSLQGYLHLQGYNQNSFGLTIWNPWEPTIRAYIRPLTFDLPSTRTSLSSSSRLISWGKTWNWRRTVGLMNQLISKRPFVEERSSDSGGTCFHRDPFGDEECHESRRCPGDRTKALGRSSK